MTGEILCPACGHSLSFHSYEDAGCQAPLGGLASHARCECPMTIHIYIQGLLKQNSSKELQTLRDQNKLYFDEIKTCHHIMNNDSEKITFLVSKIDNLKKLLEEAKSIETHPIYGWFAMHYKNDMQEIINKMILELEKTNDHSN